MTISIPRSDVHRASAGVCLLAGALMLAACNGSSDGVRSEAEQPGEPTGATSAPSNTTTAEVEDVTPGEDPSSGGRPSDAGNGARSQGPVQDVEVPEEPRKVSERSRDGAESALQYWWVLHAYARNTGDLAPLADLSTEDCAFCTRRIEASREIFDRGVRWHQDPYEVSEVQIVRQARGVYEGDFIFDEGDFVVFRPDADPETVQGEDGHTWSARLRYLEGQWRVADLRHERAPSDLPSSSRR